MRKFVIGDIHGGYLALQQVLDKANFDFENDKLISLGDVTDGWPDVAECFELLFKIKNLEYVKGNHDEWTLDYLMRALYDEPKRLSDFSDMGSWLIQGGQATVDSYEKHPDLVGKHLKYIRESKFYYVDEDNRVFVHGGFDPDFPLEQQHISTFTWDRELWSYINVFDRGTEKYNEIYVGHTPTISQHKHGRPVNIKNVWNMDTGACYMGKLSLMDIDTKEVYQSDPVFQLYPDHKGRNRTLLAEDPNWNKWGLFEEE